MSDMGQMDAAGSAHGQDTAGTSNGSFGVVAGASKPVGIVMPRKRGVVGTAVVAGSTRSMSTPAGTTRGQVNAMVQEPRHSFRPQASAQPPQPRNDAQPPGNRKVIVGSKKLKLIQQQLLLFLHVRNCQLREQSQPCTLPHCRIMTNVLNHIKTCNAGKNCTVRHCISTQQIISHWRICLKAHCPVCVPLKQAEKSRHTNDKSVATARSVAAARATPVSQQMAVAAGVAAANPQQGQNRIAGPVATARVASNIIRLPDSQPTARMQLVLPPIAIPVHISKEWHQSITSVDRHYVIHKLVRAIFPKLNSHAMFGRRMHRLIAYAGKVEGNCYQTANSRLEYYYKIQQELEERRRQHMHRQQTVGQQRIGAAPYIIYSIVPLHLKRKPLLKLARTLPRPIGTVKPTLHTLLRVHSNSVRVLQSRASARQSSNNQNVRSLTPSPTTAGPLNANNDMVASLPLLQFRMTPVSATPRRNYSESGVLTDTSTSNTPPVPAVAPASQANVRESTSSLIDSDVEKISHVFRCRNANCPISFCQRVKQVIVSRPSDPFTGPIPQENSGASPIERYLGNMMHARHCKSVNCPIRTCKTMKRVLRHMIESWSGCRIVRNSSHSTRCEEASCFATFCYNVQHRGRGLRLQQRAQLNRRSSIQEWLRGVRAQQSSSHSRPFDDGDQWR